MSMPKATAGKWGPIAFAIAPIASSDDLTVALDALLVQRDGVWAASEDKFRQWRHVMDTNDGAANEVSEALWAEYQELNREYWVLHAWHQLTHAASYFVEHGCSSASMPEVIEIELVTLPDPYWADLCK
jgi:hypothetical protein